MGGLRSAEVGVRVAVGGVVSHRVRVLLVLERRVHRQLQHTAQRRPDLHAHPPAVRRFVPDGEDVFLVAHGEHRPADLVPHLELPPQQREEQVFPVASGDALFQSDDPLAPVHVRLVLPHRLDPLAENMVVAHGRTVVDWPPQVDVETPEVLDRLCRAERRGVLLVALVRRLLEEGEGPRELKRVRFYHRSHEIVWDSSAMDSAALRRECR
eukprot:CAMPEP_0118828190 /NCGR_PEP_ID=MMETSP1162-20130426/17049_1 /TAXON_ID=33656 /ORGANISM="Phaeocystis Sp, Strain CCMP2710" /LENGTH=210 /DNA_ID=CAMNT_0006759133 /DNA_START=192 /DNA_END=820 /DNA_ORIENTATION=+